MNIAEVAEIAGVGILVSLVAQSRQGRISDDPGRSPSRPKPRENPQTP